ncbi:MAG: hypothetical protein LBI28_12775 [Treponema sp.]|jgi:hypothetical protein|nr:hypothetical protein [Treponema sp.]
MAGMYPDNQTIDLFGEPVTWPGVDEEGKFTNGSFSDPLERPSFIPAETLNLVVDNLEELIVSLGEKPNNKDTKQLAKPVLAAFSGVKDYIDEHKEAAVIDHPDKSVTNEKITDVELADEAPSYTLFDIVKKGLWQTLQEIRNNLKALFNVIPPVGASYDQGPNDLEPEERFPGTNWMLWNERAETYDLITNTAYNNLFSSTPSNWAASATIAANAYRIWIPGGVSTSGTRRIMKCIKAVTSQKPSDINWIDWEELSGVTRKARYEIQDFATTFSTDLTIGASVTISGTVYRVVGINTWSGLFASYAGVNRPTFLSGGIGRDQVRNHAHSIEIDVRASTTSIGNDYGTNGSQIMTNIGTPNKVKNFLSSVSGVDNILIGSDVAVANMPTNKWRRVN